MSDSYQIVPFERRHLIQAAELHLQAFPSFFLSFLGRRFLIELYRGFSVDPSALALVAEGRDGSMRGVIVGTLLPAGFFKRLLFRRWWAFSAASVWAVVRKPTIIGRLVQALWYRGGPVVGRNRALLSSIAVVPALQGTGVGRGLVDAWLKQVRKSGCSGCYLTTDAQGNDVVNAFYKRSGWLLESAYLATGGRRMNRYILDFDDVRKQNQP